VRSEARELEIVRLGAHGDGVAETAAGPVFVPRTLPGERIRAEIEGSHARLLEVLAASPDRVAAPCRHFGTCGGCVAQHMAERVYRDWKREMVATAFGHRGLKVDLDDMVAIAPATRRRVALGAEKHAGHTMLGFREEGTHTLVDIDACPVMVPAISIALSGLRAIADAAVPEGGALRVTVTAVQGGLDVALDGTDDALSSRSIDAKALDARARARIAQLAAAVGALRVTAGGHLVIQSAAPKLTLGGADVILPPASFVQATAEAEAAIGVMLAEATRKAKRIADLFCGAGAFTFLLARRARVTAFDGDRPAIEALAQAARGAMGTKPIETRVRDLFAEPLSRTELDGFDAVVFDPPRAGAKAQAEMIARSKVPVVCAVSCNPATLARDCRILVDGGYRIERVVPVDQFVWSPHVEAVAVLRR
jgi:23S rRNA (uracil1939-C5)-methyltransferase